MFLIPGDGRLHKAVTLDSRVHIIEELQVFPQGQPVQNLLLDSHGVSGPWNELDHFDCQPASFTSLVEARWKVIEPWLLTIKRMCGRTCQRFPGVTSEHVRRLV